MGNSGKVMCFAARESALLLPGTRRHCQMQCYKLKHILRGKLHSKEGTQAPSLQHAARLHTTSLLLPVQADRLELTKQLIGNNDEVTDLRFVGPPAAPTHLAVSSNSELIRIFSLTDMSCSASLAGHTDTILALDAMHIAAQPQGKQPLSLLVSGAKDNQIRLWDCSSGRCFGVGEGHVGAVSAVAFSRR